MQKSESKTLSKSYVIQYRCTNDIRELAPENGIIQVLDMKDNFCFVVY